jgi:hypothetical protein
MNAAPTTAAMMISDPATMDVVLTKSDYALKYLKIKS